MRRNHRTSREPPSEGYQSRSFPARPLSTQSAIGGVPGFRPFADSNGRPHLPQAKSAVGAEGDQGGSVMANQGLIGELTSSLSSSSSRSHAQPAKTTPSATPKVASCFLGLEFHPLGPPPSPLRRSIRSAHSTRHTDRSDWEREPRSRPNSRASLWPESQMCICGFVGRASLSPCDAGSLGRTSPPSGLLLRKLDPG